MEVAEKVAAAWVEVARAEAAKAGARAAARLVEAVMAVGAPSAVAQSGTQLSAGPHPTVAAIDRASSSRATGTTCYTRLRRQ